MNNINCNIVRDLLPAYLDKLTSKESNEFVESHLKECEQCGEIFSSLSQSIVIDTADANREIDYLKKIKAKRKTLLAATALVCTVIFGIAAFIGVKVFIIGEPISYPLIDFDTSDEFVGIGTKFNEETNELTIYGEILLNQTVFSGIKVEKSKALLNTYDVTVYGAQGLFANKEYNRKFEETIKIPDDNKRWQVYSIGEIPQDTIMFWSNEEYINKKSEKQLQRLTDFLAEKEGISSESSRFMCSDFDEVLGDDCYIFDLSFYEVGTKDLSDFRYGVSLDCKKIYKLKIPNSEWVLEDTVK